MKKTRSCLYWLLGIIFLCLVLAALAWKPFFLKTSDVNACVVDLDCIIVRPVGCGYPNSINQSSLALWNLHYKLRQKLPFPPIIGACAPSPPVEAFQHECLQGTCRAIVISDHAFLEFSQEPVLGVPTDLFFRIRSSSGLEDSNATIEFMPNLVTVHSGNLTWEGTLAPNTEEQIQLSVIFPKPGYYQIHGEALPIQGDSLQDDVYLLITDEGVQYGEKPTNQWDISHSAYPVGENDPRLFRELVLDPVPVLDGQTTITYRIRPAIDLSSVTIQLVLPPGAFTVGDVEYPAGGEQGVYGSTQYYWSGSAQAGETLEIRATVKVTKTGWGYAYGDTRSTELPENVIMAFVYVDEYNGYCEIRERP